MKFKKLNESYEEDIKRISSNLYSTIQSMKDALSSLEYYLEDDYESEANLVRALGHDFEDFENNLRSELEDIKNIIEPEEEEVEEEMKFTKVKKLNESDNVREYSDMLYDMIEEDAVDAKHIAEDLIYWCSEDDIKRYMEVNDLIYEDEEEIEEACEEKAEDVSLTEKNWKYYLSEKNSKAIRDAIDKEDYENLQIALGQAWSEIHDLIPDQFDEDDLESKLEDINYLDTAPDEDIDITEKDVEENWNYELSDFYDFCDSNLIWIAL